MVNPKPVMRATVRLNKTAIRAARSECWLRLQQAQSDSVLTGEARKTPIRCFLDPRITRRRDRRSSTSGLRLSAEERYSW